MPTVCFRHCGSAWAAAATSAAAAAAARHTESMETNFLAADFSSLQGKKNEIRRKGQACILDHYTLAKIPTKNLNVLL